MSCTSVCPFRTLSKEVQLAIYGKMCETELKTLSEICTVAKQFMKTNVWITLKLHPEDRITITADKRAVSVFVTGPRFQIDGKKIDLQSYTTIAPITVDHVKISVTDFSQLSKVSDSINKMSLVCNSASFFGGIHSSIVLSWTNAMKCPDGISVECCGREMGNEILENLTQIENTAGSFLSFSGLSDYYDLLDDARMFGKVEVETTGHRIEDFINNLINGKELGNLEEITLITRPCLFCDCSLKRISPAATLLYQKSKECSFSKLPLDNNKCLFIEEKVKGEELLAICKLMEDKEEEILDLLVEKMNLSESQKEALFGPKWRNSYLALDDIGREQYMRRTSPLNIRKIPCGFGVLIK